MQRSPSARSLGSGVGLALAAALLTACAGTTGDAPSAGGHGGAVPGDLGLEHVHGLAVDPTDGELYAASHYGVFRLPADGAAERIADRYQDTMGFTITDDGTFLGSGHPGFGTDPAASPLLGLIRSTDRAETWQAVSLEGEADFHALRAAGDRLYGYDSTSGDLMMSDDEGASWQTRSRTAVYDLAVDPRDPDGLLATTDAGPALSRDQGRTFAPLTDAPPLRVLAWAGPDLFAVDETGTVHVSPDDGSSWTSRGSLGGAPQALHVTEDGELFAAIDDRILASGDGGASWDVRYEE